MSDIQPQPDALTECMVVVRGHQRQDTLTASQSQDIQELSAAKSLALNHGHKRSGIIVDDVIGTQKNLYRCALAQQRATTAVTLRSQHAVE